MWTAHQHSTHTNTHAKTVRRACMHIHKQAHAHTLNVDRADKLTHKHKHTHTHTHIQTNPHLINIWRVAGALCLLSNHRQQTTVIKENHFGTQSANVLLEQAGCHS